MDLLAEGTPEEISQMEIDTIVSDPDCYNLHQGGHIGFDVMTKDAESVEAWKSKLRVKRSGRKPAQGMKHSQQVKELCGQASKARWDKQGRYSVDDLSFREAKEKYGISKTHYYRLRRSTNNAT